MARPGTKRATSALAASLVAFAVGLDAAAQGPPPTPPSPGMPPAAAKATAPLPPVEVRIGLSERADRVLGAVRLRRLLEIELEDSAVLAPGLAGPLADHVAHVWVDVTPERRTHLEVRLGERPVVRRDLDTSGVAADVAARLGAITIADLVRSQARAARPRPKPPARKPSREELAFAARGAPTVELGAGLVGAYLPEPAAGFGGPEFRLGFRLLGLEERVFARWLVGGADATALRWAEAGIAFEYVPWATPHQRFRLGVAAAAATVELAGASAVGGVGTTAPPGSTAAGSARAGAVLGLEQVVGPAWVGLALEPGWVLHDVAYDERPGVAAPPLEGPFLGGTLSIALDRRSR